MFKRKTDFRSTTTSVLGLCVQHWVAAVTLNKGINICRHVTPTLTHSANLHWAPYTHPLGTLLAYTLTLRCSDNIEWVQWALYTHTHWALYRPLLWVGTVSMCIISLSLYIYIYIIVWWTSMLPVWLPSLATLHPLCYWEKQSGHPIGRCNMTASLSW